MLVKRALKKVHKFHIWWKWRFYYWIYSFIGILDCITNYNSNPQYWNAMFYINISEAVFMKIIGHIRHFRWLDPNVWCQISQIRIEYIMPMGRMFDESWKFFRYAVRWPALSRHCLFCTKCWLYLLSMKWVMCGTPFLHISNSLGWFYPRTISFEKKYCSSYLWPLYEIYILY